MTAQTGVVEMERRNGFTPEVTDDTALKWTWPKNLAASVAVTLVVGGVFAYDYVQRQPDVAYKSMKDALTFRHDQIISQIGERRVFSTGIGDLQKKATYLVIGGERVGKLPDLTDSRQEAEIDLRYRLLTRDAAQKLQASAELPEIAILDQEDNLVTTVYKPTALVSAFAQARSFMGKVGRVFTTPIAEIQWGSPSASNFAKKESAPTRKDPLFAAAPQPDKHDYTN